MINRSTFFFFEFISHRVLVPGI